MVVPDQSGGYMVTSWDMVIGCSLWMFIRKTGSDDCLMYASISEKYGLPSDMVQNLMPIIFSPPAGD